MTMPITTRPKMPRKGETIESTIQPATDAMIEAAIDGTWFSCYPSRTTFQPPIGFTVAQLGPPSLPVP